MKVWITKYALTKGIIEVDDPKNCNNDLIKCLVLGSLIYFIGEGKEWHKTKERAIAKAEEMRVKAIAAHLKGIAKLEHQRDYPLAQRSS
jgi:hypothetical protein